MASQLNYFLPILVVSLLALAAAVPSASASAPLPAQAAAVASVAPSAIEDRQNATLTMVSSAASAAVGSSVTLSGSISPVQDGTVFLYHSLNEDVFFLFGSANLSAGSYSYNATLANPGTYVFCAVWSGNDDYNSSTSNIVSVTSLAQPGGLDGALLIIAGAAAAAAAIAALFLISRRKK